MQTQSTPQEETVYTFRALTVRVNRSTFKFHVYRGESLIDPFEDGFTTKDEAIHWIMSSMERDSTFAKSDFTALSDKVVEGPTFRIDKFFLTIYSQV